MTDLVSKKKKYEIQKLHCKFIHHCNFEPVFIYSCKAAQSFFKCNVTLCVFGKHLHVSHTTFIKKLSFIM